MRFIRLENVVVVFYFCLFGWRSVISNLGSQALGRLDCSRLLEAVELARLAFHVLHAVVMNVVDLGDVVCDLGLKSSAVVDQLDRLVSELV